MHGCRKSDQINRIQREKLNAYPCCLFRVDKKAICSSQLGIILCYSLQLPPEPLSSNPMGGATVSVIDKTEGGREDL